MSRSESTRNGADGAASRIEESYLRQGLLLAAWAAFWMVVQGLLSLWGLSIKAQVGFLLLGLFMVFGGALAGLRVGFLRLLTSLPFAVSQVFFMGLVVLLGLLVPQELGPESYVERFGPSLGAWIRSTQIGDLFHSLWFFALLAGLAFSMLAVAWKRRPYPAAKFGFLLVHVAPTLVFAGGLWGQFSGVKALAELKVGQGTYSFARVVGGETEKPYVLPGFQVRLERFEVRRTGEPEYRLIASSRGAGQARARSEAFAVTEGEKGKLSNTGLEFRVERLIPNAVEFEKLPVPPKESRDPDVLAVMLGVGRPEPLLGYLQLFGEEGSRKDEPLGRFTVMFRPSLDPGLLSSLCPRSPRSEKIVAERAGGIQEFPAKLGELLQFDGINLKIRALYPDFQVLRDAKGNPVMGSRSKEPRDPWLELELQQPGGSPVRVLLSAREPEYAERLNESNLPKGLKLRYVREGEEVQRCFVVFSKEGNRVDLVKDGRVARTERWELNRPFLVEPGLSVTAVGLLDCFYSAPAGTVPGSPAMRIKLEDPRTGGVEGAWLAASPGGPEQGRPFFGGRVSLRYVQVSPEPKEFRSTLVIADPQGRELARKVVSVDESLIYDGHAFRQSSRAPRNAETSLIVVVDQPGAWLAWLGYAMLLIGIAWMFYLKPWLKAKAEAGRGVR